MLQRPTYEYHELKVLIPRATLLQTKEIAVTIRNEKKLYSTNDYSHILILISERLIKLSNEILT
jgi:hypothetical protein